MKATFILCVATVLIGLAGIAWGHYPEGMTFFAFQWPSGQEPVLDGDLSEWDVLPEAYIQDADDFMPVRYSGHHPPPPPDPASLQVLRSAIGWSPAQNQLYLMIEVLDDVVLFNDPESPKPSGDLVVGFFIDADHSGDCYAGVCWGEEEEQAQATDYLMGTIGPDEILLDNENLGNWSELPPWMEGGCHSTVLANGMTRVAYEMAVVPFDWLSSQGLEQSVVHQLREGEILGLLYVIQDTDPSRFLYGYTIIDTDNDYLHDAGRFTDVLLMPVEEAVFGTAFQGSTWGWIKASFKE